MSEFNGVKVFSTTKGRERDLLGETVTDWLRANPDKEIVDKTITQSSDSAFHCLTITLFYKFSAKEGEKPFPPDDRKPLVFMGDKPPVPVKRLTFRGDKP